jgi:hypothetical protein
VNASRLEAEIEIEIMQILYLSVTIEMTLWTERETLLVAVMSHAQGEDLPSVRSRAIRFGAWTRASKGDESSSEVSQGWRRTTR